MKTGFSSLILKVFLVNFCLFQLLISSATAQDIVADAGPDTAYESGAVVILDGSNSYDNDSDCQALTYSWYISKKPAGSLASLINPASATPEFTVDIEGIYIATLTVINEDNLSAADTVKIDVCPYSVYDGDYHAKTQEDLDALSGYTKVSGNLSIGGEYNINKRSTFKNLDALSCLTSIGGNLSIGCNAELENLDGLKNLRSVNTNDPFYVLYTLTIAYNDKLKNLEGLKNLTSLGQQKSGLTIYNNPQLNTLNGLQNLTSITLMSIYDNPLLINFQGLENLSTTSCVTISRNDTLTDLSALRSVTTLDWLRLDNNDSLVDLRGLENLETILTHLRIENHRSLSNLDALSSLCSVGQASSGYHDLTITNNTSLCTEKAEALRDQVTNCPGGGLGATTTISDNLIVCD